MAFNQTKYIIAYNKENYARFLVDLPKKDKEDLDKILKEDKMTKADFLRWAINEYKKTRKH
jgi:hypothetical protein